MEKEKIVLVSANLTVDYCTCLDSFIIKDFSWDNITTFIYNEGKEAQAILSTTFTDDTKDRAVGQKKLWLNNLRKILNKVPFCVYICKQETLDPFVCELFLEHNFPVYTDEGYITDKEELEFVIQSNGTIGTELSISAKDMQEWIHIFEGVLSGNMEVINCLQTNPEIIEAMKDNTMKMHNLYAYANTVSLELLPLLQHCDDLTKEIAEVCNEKLTIETNLNDLNTKYSEVSKQIADLKERMNSTVGNNVFVQQKGLYAPVNINIISKKVLYVKCVGFVPFLKSFMYYYAMYLKTRLKKDTVLFCIRPDCYLDKEIYSEMRILENKTANLMIGKALKEKKDDNKVGIWITSEPTQFVFEEFFKLNSEVILIIDESQCENIFLKPQLNLHTLYAFQSLGVYNRLCAGGRKWLANVSNQDLLKHGIFSIDFVQDAFINIPFIDKYKELGIDTSMRNRSYAAFGMKTKSYQNLTKLLGIE